MEVRTKNIICGFVEGQTHVGMPRGAKMSLPLLNLMKLVAFPSYSNSTYEHAPQEERNY